MTTINTDRTTTTQPSTKDVVKVAEPFLSERPVVRGKFFYADGEQMLVRGVTYGPFKPTEDGCEYHTIDRVRRDFGRMAKAGFNTVRTYTVPPRWLLDVASENGLRVFVGMPWEQHVTFLDSAKTRNAIIKRIRESVRTLAGHPALFAFAVGNEIPPSIVRWYGRPKIERFIRRLFDVIKAEDPGALVTYVNFPTTEYLKLDFLDFQCANVYLEDEDVLRRYLLRLQNLSGSRPLLLGEVGLDTLRNGHDKQVEVLQWQIRVCFAAGAAGTFIFKWTDEWYRGGADIEDWDFGLTDRQGNDKPALEAVSRAIQQTPFTMDRDWPRISVVICTYNGSRTIAETIRKVAVVDYPNYEVVVIDDGSQDKTSSILFRLEQELNDLCDLRIVRVDNGGLSRARNLGYQHATGEIIAYLDDDAYPDPRWLQYVADTFMTTDAIGVGGPNLPVPEDNEAAYCVAHSPGGPNHVLLDDVVAEHIPGCNMAFRKSALEACGGCDPTFRIAGDDVDLCWRLQDAGGVIRFNPAAVVWHHRRDSISGYLRQQKNYGRAEAMLQNKWPQRYNLLGHAHWAGRIYGDGLTLPLIFRRNRIYHGRWGTALFQTLYTRPAGVLHSMPLMPEWYLLVLVGLVVALAGLVWNPLLIFTPVLAIAFGLPMIQAIISAKNADMREVRSWSQRMKLRTIVAALHIAQPIVRLKGRILQGLTPWRRPKIKKRFVWPMWRKVRTIWTEKWIDPNTMLTRHEYLLRDSGTWLRDGGDFDNWDQELRGGLCGGVRVLMAVEEHGQGRQFYRFKAWPIVPGALLILLGAVLGTAVLLCWGGIVELGILLLIVAMVLSLRAFFDAGAAMAAHSYCLSQLKAAENK